MEMKRIVRRSVASLACAALLGAHAPRVALADDASDARANSIDRPMPLALPSAAVLASTRMRPACG